jgi:hypothetical protein
MTCLNDEILFCRWLHVIVTKLIVYRKKKNKRNISFIQEDIGDCVRSDGVFKS